MSELNFPFPYTHGLYRRNNFSQPCVWYAAPFDYCTIQIYHGIVGKTITSEIISTKRNPVDEIKSRVNAKRKVGYKYLEEIKDNNSTPIGEMLLSYLLTYLPEYRTTGDNNLLPMLAKVYTPKAFDKCSQFYGQYKINGLRCFINAYTTNDIFNNVRLKFQSREGTIWNSLQNLENYIIDNIDINLLNKMIDENYVLDGELYLPGCTVNEINHFVKDANCKENKLLQFWCYDIAIEDTPQFKRFEYLKKYCSNKIVKFDNKESHLNTTTRFNVLGNYTISDNNTAIFMRNSFIDLGFEGIILRNPDAEYQYGKRNASMFKYKNSTDGLFTIIDIYPEGIKRKNIPLFLLRNDINDATFEVHISGTQHFQSLVLDNKEKFIGKQLMVEYGERSGVNNVPFHVKEVHFVN